MSAPHEEAALARVPDLPQWIDTRGMLHTGRALVTFPSSQRFFSDGFVVELASRALLSAIGNPPAEIVAERACAMQGEVNVLCAEDTAETVGDALPSWIRRGVRLFALPGVMPWEHGPDDSDVAIFTRANTPSLAHLPEIASARDRRRVGRTPFGALRPRQAARTIACRCVTDAGSGRRGLDGRPTGRVLLSRSSRPKRYGMCRWKRSKGFEAASLPRAPPARWCGTCAARTRRRSGAQLETNAASLSVARQLGFEEAGRLMVFART